MRAIAGGQKPPNHFRLEAKEKPPIPDGHSVRIVFHAYFDVTNIV
jgi:hypothetical protein